MKHESEFNCTGLTGIFVVASIHVCTYRSALEDVWWFTTAVSATLRLACVTTVAAIFCFEIREDLCVYVFMCIHFVFLCKG